ncbi:MAG: DUF928 domain-containing protein [Pyrinomonadaceae bacterium MAG19_C2-C3]|nr:DUF928 domain-containing protein [Pyrinomonadaceae bacterium MAG19_C2-C3]
MSKVFFASLRSALATLTLSAVIVTGLVAAQAQQQPTPRRPLPKPPAGARGFEQYGTRDASSRLISAGATRDIDKPRIPSAPLLGLAYDARPYFMWSPDVKNNAPSYHFALYDGDVAVNSAAKVIYETDVTKAELAYPATAPALAPGKLYSWRVMSMEDGTKMTGTAVSFFVLSPADAAEVKRALTNAKLTNAKTPAEQMKQAEIFAEYGVWYDALRIANDLAVANPSDEAATNFYDKMMDQLKASQEARLKALQEAKNK